MLSNCYEIRDITVSVESGTICWPGTPQVRVEHFKALDQGDRCNESMISLGSHTGTHVDAPSHHFSDGVGVERLDLSLLTGPCAVVTIPDAGNIGPDQLNRAAIPSSCKRLLLHTGNSRFWRQGVIGFQPQFTGLRESGAKWIVEHGIQLVGVDYLSIQPWKTEPDVHRILLSNEIIIVEGLDLTDVEDGEWEMFCLPLLLTGADGAPARTILRRPSRKGHANRSDTGLNE